MILNPIPARKALNKAFLKIKPNRNEIDCFRENLIRLLDQINEAESEEFHKNLISVFLRDTYFHNQYFINTKSRNDLVIHNGKDAKTPVGVIIEAKKPTNKAEMISRENINQKALQELLLYYLRERITNNNLELKYLIVTNIYEWFIFDVHLFEKHYSQNKALVKQFTGFESGRMGGKTTDFFYKEIAAPAIASVDEEFAFTYFDIRDFDKPLRSSNKDDNKVIVSLYKIFTPQHLLKLPFANDSNSLDKAFYSELLHIIGLTEVKVGGRKLIERRKEGDRYPASLIENAILQLDSLDKISRLSNPEQFGQNKQERLFNLAIELSITWINRILFLKLLEAQLVRYHKGDMQFTFLNIEKIKNFDDLNLLFFSVLARLPEERPDSVKQYFSLVPYLNSSLFEPTELEHSCFFISQLNDGTMPIMGGTVLKNDLGKKRSGHLETIEYLFEFLNSYDFSSEGAEDIQEDNKTLINASVLGLIFEKINGYKDGSFFTPGFITMYMCRETIRKVVVQKFNEAKDWKCADIKGLFDKIEDKKEANQIINSLKICDPAVGSGHFLVSALNEIIAIKSELKILLDRFGKTLRDYHVEVINDELIVTDDDSRPFEYHPENIESQRVQEALFHEKQTIIENCLFGVDINPNSVKICRLRLWIELLKNAYYRNDNGTDRSRPVPTLETLPNIDINIKCGNSLISKYPLDADLRQLLRSSKWTIDSYRLAVMTYRNAKCKEEKQAMENLILKIKQDFTSEIRRNDPKKTRLEKLANELYNRFTGISLFEPEDTYSRKEKDFTAKRKKEQEKLEKEIEKLTQEIEVIKCNKIYKNAFEWRFEFPEVLNDEGKYIGFDIIIGNPPYIILTKQNTDNVLLNALLTEFQSIKNSSSKNIFLLFVEKGIHLLYKHGYQAMIVPEGLFSTRSYSECVDFMNSYGTTETITTIEGMVFDEANTGNVIFIYLKNSKTNTCFYHFNKFKELISIEKEDLSIIQKIRSINSVVSLKEICGLFKGMVVHDRKSFVFNEWNNKIPDKFLLGNCMSKWTINYWKYTDYNFLNIIGGTKLKVKYEVFPRILIRRTGDYLCCAYLEEPALTESTIYSCWSNSSEFDNKYILALLHSKLFDYFIKKLMITNKQAFPQILMADIEELPVMRINQTDQKVFVAKTTEIITLKKSNPLADITFLEEEIDRLVYELYGLTEEEIKIVEGK